MNKLKLIFSIFIFGFIAIIGKLFYIQIINAQAYSADYITTQKIAPVRGRILDRNGEPFAINQTTYLLYVEPKVMKDEQYLVRKLDEILKLGEATIDARIDKDKNWVSIKGNISKETKEQIQKLKLPEVGFQEEQKRYYPEASLAAHLIGFVGKDKDGENVGYFGVEGYYDKDLSGLPGVLKSERDLFGRPIFVGTQDRVDAEDGRDLILTIDKTVQNIVKQKLKEGIERSSAKSGCAIAVDPNTMEILGLSCLPDFDPETYYDFTEKDFSNTAIGDIYEPGSTFKPLVMAAAIEEGVLTPDSVYDEAGPLDFDGIKIRNYNNVYENKITMTHIMEKSSNVGMVYVKDKLGDQKFYDYLKKYGFGSTAGIDLEGESGGYLKPMDEWYEIDFATAAFGQGIGITRLQLVRAFAAVINGGYLMRPYIVKEVVEGNNHYKREPQVIRRVLSKDTSLKMRKMLVSTVDYAKIDWERPEGYKVGGKTGTAQVAISGNYDPSKTIASFIGFAPAEEPKFLVLVVLKEPGLSGFGSTTAAPIFFSITKELLSYYNVMPNF